MVQGKADVVSAIVDRQREGWYAISTAIDPRSTELNQARQSGADRRAARLRRRQDQGIRHRRQRPTPRPSASAPCRKSAGGFLDALAQCRRLSQGVWISTRRTHCNSSNKKVGSCPTPVVHVCGASARRSARGLGRVEAIKLDIDQGEFLSLTALPAGQDTLLRASSPVSPTRGRRAASLRAADGNGHMPSRRSDESSRDHTLMPWCTVGRQCTVALSPYRRVGPGSVVSVVRGGNPRGGLERVRARLSAPASGGMRMRVVDRQRVVTGPRNLPLDGEPFAALDEITGWRST